MKKLGTVKRMIPVFIGLMLVSACEMFPDGRVSEEEENRNGEDRFAFLRKEEQEAAAGRQTGPKESDEITVEQEKEKNALPDAALRKLEKADPKDGGADRKIRYPVPFYEDFLLLDDGKPIAVSLVFNSAPIVDVIPAFADVLGFNFLADSELKNTVTLNINTNMTRRDLWTAFERMLSLAGAAVRVDGSLLRIIPASKLAQQPDLTVQENGEEPLEICYYPLKNTTAKDVVAQIKPFLTKDAVVAELTRPNAVLLSDSASNVVKLKQILELADRSGKNEWPRLVLKCDNILPSRIVAELKEVFPVLGFYVMQTTDKTDQPGSVQLTAIDRLQLIVGSAATPDAVNEIRNWVKILDSTQSLDQERVFVYKVLHGKAERLLSGLAVIYNTSGQSLTIDSDTGNVRTENVSSSSSGTTRTNAASSNNNVRTGTNSATDSTGTDQTSNLFETPVRIFADGELNRLVIRTTPRTYASIKAVLDRLDVVPAQVLLQVLVVEVTLDKSTEFGLEFSAQGSVNGNVIGGGTNYSNLNPFVVNKDSSGEITSIYPNKESGISGLLYNPDNPTQKFGYIRALAKNGNVRVISSPQVLVSSHKEAEIWVGERVPYIASAITDTASQSSSSTAYNTSVSFEEVGIRMTITPEVTSTEYIGLDVSQELSGVDETGKAYSDSVNCPIFWKRTVETNMTIRNGQTMVIGGLIQEKKNDSLESLPIIANIPLLRRLFGSTDASAQRSEILILITGTVIDEKSKVEDMIRKYNDAIKALNQFDSKLGDRPGAGQKMHVLEKEEL